MESGHSNYGKYEIDESLELSLPNSMIKIEKIGKNAFSYYRVDSEDNISQKVIPTTSDKIEIELSPIRPLNHPAKRTNYMYLDFDSPIFLSENMSATIFARCPIEVGLFLVHSGHKDSLDWLTCDPVNSRFGLYGTPESGTLCKYVKSHIVESYHDSVPYMNGIVKINLKNELDSGHSISKFVFPLFEYNLYYKNNEVIFDTVNVVLKKKATIETLDVSPLKLETDWTLAPSYERLTISKRLELGVD